MIATRTSESPVELLIQQESQERLEAGMADALAQLSAREQFILSRRFCLNGEERATLSECARTLKVSPERVRQVEARALRRLAYRVRDAAAEALDLQRCPRCECWVLTLRFGGTQSQPVCGDCCSSS